MSTLRSIAIPAVMWCRGIWSIALLSASLLAAPTFASEANDAQIKTLAILKDDYPGLVFIEVVGQRTALPTCHTNGLWAYVLRLTNDDDKRIFSLLTIAKLNQSSVRLVGRGSCEPAGTIESLAQVWLK